MTLDKAEAAYRTHQPEAIDFCKCALETICKAVLDEKGASYVNATGKFHELPRLIKDTITAAGCQNDQIKGNIGGLAQALAEMRNDDTVAGHGLVAPIN